jgi:CDP-paratose 2-epimerase
MVMRILVIGGAGFIGTNIVLKAIRNNHTPIVFDSFIRKGTEHNIQPDVEYIRGDVRNLHDFERIPTNIDGIINLAGNPGVPWSMTWPLYDFSVNALGALHVLEFARTHGNIPVVFASTNKVYHDGINDIRMYQTDARYRWFDYEGIPETFSIDSQGKHPKSPYGVSKTAADLYHQEYWHMYKLPTVINRMSCIYGLYQQGVEDQGWISHFIKQIAKGDKTINIYGSGKQVRDMLWGEDVARLYIDELENINKYQGGVFNVGGGIDNTLSINEAITEIERQTGNNAILTHHDERPADQRIYISDITKVCKVNGWKPEIQPEEGIRRMIYECINSNL